jgi:2-polyprenyl-3-methyl-5-hydroxy-6-metoxy-1,4-benzoquinol methylase
MTTFEKRLFDSAVAPYVQAGKFAMHFARGKLSGDQVFREILQRGLIASDSHVVDIGCGQGLLSAWLLAAGDMAADSDWPKNWGQAPRNVTVKGIELMPADVERANTALKAHANRFTFEVGDMCSTAFGKAQTVAILDVLHYVPYAAQEDVLARVRDALAPQGLLILRIGDAGAGWGFRVSNWVDSVVFFMRGHKSSRLYCRTLAEWISVLQKIGFQVETKPMSEGTPFANVLMLARLNG